jgi:alkanesulfonate monooxygenase SsuD/methylene tetrahydromethanopterin reductase-like flavin-dependent oxidoreductase (luciferase family)
MKFGLFIMGTRDSSYLDIFDQMVYAEELGFNAVVLGERHFRHGNLLYSSPLSLASALAARTERIRIGTAARVLSLDHPIHIAEDAATLDVLSRGRLDFGVTRASLDEECHLAFGSPVDETRARFRESIEIIVKAWTEERFSYDGKFHQIPDVSVLPKPLQKPHPPISIVAVSQETLVFAGENGYSAITGATRTPSELEQTAKRYYGELITHGGDGTAAELIINRFIYVSDTDEKAKREMEQPFMEFIKCHAPDLEAALAKKYGGEEYFSFDRFMEDFCLFGSPETVTCGINEIARKVGINYLLCSLNFITQSHSLCVKSTELFAREVIPNFLISNEAKQI